MPLFILNMLLNWAVPFLFLLPRGPKRSLKRLAQVAAVVLAGRWLDLYLMILPPVLGRSPAFGVPEIGGALIPCGLAGLAVSWGMRQAPAVPVQDPYLVESLNYHN